jgi:PiT family inorganic phosphate transporter
MMTIVVLVIAMALLFDFLNGMNDAANSIATVVSTRVLTPFQAVVWAAFFNFAAYYLVGTNVANTIAKLIPNPEDVSVVMVLAALLGGILWTHLCTAAGLPISVSHALIGGVMGVAFAKMGLHDGWMALNRHKLYEVAIFIVVSPFAGLAGAILLSIGQAWAFRKAARQTVRKVFRWGQLASSAAFSLSHGASDAQKMMGIIMLALMAAGKLPSDYKTVPTWIPMAAYTAIGLGTLAGGWSVIHTMGTKLTKLQPSGGFCAETSGAIVCLTTAAYGIPVSTTHTITGSIMGVGAAHRLGAVRWGVAGKIIWAWVLTIPCSALVGALTWWALDWASGKWG